MLYAAYRFFPKFPETRKQYLERAEEVSADCWLTNKFCEDVFVKDKYGDWSVYYFHIEIEDFGYHEFTVAIHHNEIYLIDSFSDRYQPRIIQIHPLDFSTLLSSEWPDFFRKYFVPDVVVGEDSSVTYTQKQARICPRILKCIMESKI